MFRITEDPSLGSLVQYVAKTYKNGSIVSVDMDKVGVMAAYSDPLWMCVVHCIGRHFNAFLYSELHTFKYFIILILSTYYILCISWIIKCLIMRRNFVIVTRLMILMSFKQKYVQSLMNMDEMANYVAGV